jgi:hypothetical protein
MRNILLRGTHRLAEYVEHGDFNRVFKVVANKRVWDMASVMPAEEEPATSDEAEPEATAEPAPSARVEGSEAAKAKAADAVKSPSDHGEPMDVPAFANESRTVKQTSAETQRKLREAVRSAGEFAVGSRASGTTPVDSFGATRPLQTRSDHSTLL